MANKKQTSIIEEAKSDKLRKEAEKYVVETLHNNEGLYQRAIDLVYKLGLGGLWRGIDLAMMHTIKALENEQILLRDKIDRIPQIVIKEAEQSASDVIQGSQEDISTSKEYGFNEVEQDVEEEA